MVRPAAIKLKAAEAVQTTIKIANRSDHDLNFECLYRFKSPVDSKFAIPAKIFSVFKEKHENLEDAAAAI